MLNYHLLKQLFTAMLLAGVANSIYALGLGGIELKSSLGEPFSAVINLIDAEDLSATDMIVEIADDEVYQRLAIERPFFHQGLRIVAVRKNTGFILQLNSDKPVKEPFLNFVLSLRWPKGSVLKEYTVLLDLPAAITPVEIEAKSETTQTIQPSSRPRSHSTVLKSEPPQADLASEVVMEGRYFSQSGDSLWRVAQKIRRSNRQPMAKIMQAVFVANPSAFIKNDPGRLKPAYWLSIPSDATIGAAVNIMPSRNDREDIAIPPVVSEKVSVAISQKETNKIALSKDVTAKSMEVTVLEEENAALGKRIVELELLTQGLENKLQLMDEQILQMTVVKPIDASVPDAAMEIAATISSENNAKKNSLKGQDSATVANLFNSFWLLGLSTVVLVLLITVALIYFRLRNKASQKPSAVTEKIPFWEMPAQDLSHVAGKKDNKSAFNRPDQAYAKFEKSKGMHS